MTITLRNALATDHDAWLVLWRGYQAFYETDLPADTSATTWQRLLDPTEPMHAVLAERAGRVVGLVHFIEHRSTWSVGNAIYLQDLYTAPEARGHGVGRALIEHVYARAALMGAAKVHWLTHETNRQAMALYDQLAQRPGFVQYRKVI